jgi:hypothetical protein
MIGDFFENIWGSQEVKYSSVIAQTLGLSECFKDFLENRIGINNSDSQIISIETERFLGDFGQIDILVNYNSGFMVGVENKKWDVIRPRQLHRYAEALEKESNNNYKLVFLAPSTRVVSENEKPEGLITISYKEIIEWIKNTSIKCEFENTYFQHLLLYIEVLEMKPLEDNEIKSLLYYSTCLKKLDAILNDLKKDTDEKIESSLGNFKLLYRMINGFPVYIGVRFGTNWYYSDNLLNDEPEFLIFIKDIWGDSEQQYNNNRAENICSKLKSDDDLKNETINFYPRKNVDECRLVIRRSLQDFENRSISDVVSWFTKIIDKFEKNT